jgi:hypothetical protein
MGRGGGGGSGGTSSSEIPESPTPRSGWAPAANNGPTYNFSGPIYANDSKSFVRKVDRDFRDLGYANRRVSNA